MSKYFKNIQQLTYISSIFLALGISVINADDSSALDLKVLTEDKGFFDDQGFHLSRLENYYVGSCGGVVTSNNVPMCPDGLGEEIRNFFVFPTQNISSNNLTNAVLSLQNPSVNVNVDGSLYPNPSVLNSFNSVDGSENYRLRRITANPNNLELLIGNDYASGSAIGQQIFNRLGSGIAYNQPATTITDADNGTFIDINLNQNAVNDILSTGGKFGAGGSFETLDPAPDKLESGFAFTNDAFRRIGTGAVGNEPASLNLTAGEFTVNATDRGFYSETGFFVANGNFIAGDCRGDFSQCTFPDGVDVDLGGEQRNFFVFDLSPIDELDGEYDAFLKLEIPDTFTLANGDPGQGFASTADDSENYILADVTTSIEDLLTEDLDGGSPGTEIFADLGTGEFYSEEFEITEDDLGSFIEVPLNLDALEEIVSSFGGQFAISGAITTLNNNVGIADDEFAFAGTNAAFGITGPDSVQLVFRESVGGLSTDLPPTFPTAFAVASDDSPLEISALNAVGISAEDIINVNNAANNQASTPEPSSLIGLLGLGALGFVSKKKKNKKNV